MHYFKRTKVIGTYSTSVLVFVAQIVLFGTRNKSTLIAYLSEKQWTDRKSSNLGISVFIFQKGNMKHIHTELALLPQQ